ncbi:MAG: hypothetical protein KKF14_20855 [Alphaproteobacteria bacterium]|nr:hypothetical protein [Alphaproteobacteria bacterium]
MPPRLVILSKLAALVDGHLSPADASKWADTWLLADQTSGTDVRIEDWPAWEAIKLLAGADLQASPGAYLHGVADFRDWFETLRLAPLPSTGSRGKT